MSTSTTRRSNYRRWRSAYMQAIVERTPAQQALVEQARLDMFDMSLTQEQRRAAYYVAFAQAMPERSTEP